MNFTSFNENAHQTHVPGNFRGKNFRGFVKLFSAKFGSVTSLAANFLPESYETVRAIAKATPLISETLHLEVTVGLPA